MSWFSDNCSCFSQYTAENTCEMICYLWFSQSNQPWWIFGCVGTRAPHTRCTAASWGSVWKWPCIQFLGPCGLRAHLLYGSCYLSHSFSFSLLVNVSVWPFSVPYMAPPHNSKHDAQVLCACPSRAESYSHVSPPCPFFLNRCFTIQMATLMYE